MVAALDSGSFADSDVHEFPQDDPSVVDTDDGGAVVKISDEEEQKEVGFYDNLVDLIDPTTLESLATTLLEDIKRDKEARKKHEKMYAESIKRTGLGKEAPGGAEFEGASKAVHPLLTETSIDFAARAIKELMPSAGPVRVFIPGEQIDAARFDKAERVKNYMNWQFRVQMKEFRAELENMLPQVALGGSQYMRLVPDQSKRRKRPVPQYVPSDQVFIPYAASSFYTAERQTYAENVSRMEFELRVKAEMYSSVGELTTSQMPERGEAQKASDKVEGKEDEDPYNEDGIRIVYLTSLWQHFEEDEEANKSDKNSEEPSKDLAPYLISLDEQTRKICSVVRNWEQDDEYMDRMDWIVEFPFVPWRGAFSIGVGQMIGSLAGAATGALRALLDSAHINNLPTAIRLKGANFSGQSKELNATEVIEIEGGVGGDDVRKLIMPLPFNPPQPVLMELLGFCVDSGRGVVRTTFESLAEDNKNLPVGTTLALIEEGQKVLSAIHLRLYEAMTNVIRILHRINKMYLTEDEVLDEVGTLLAYRQDFQDPMDVIPTADPEVFSDVQRMAQLQIVSERAMAMPQLYNQRAVEKMLLQRAKIPAFEELLIPEQKAEEMNAVNENAAMALGRPVVAMPEQKHLAHIQVLVDFLLNPMFGASPLIQPTFVPPAMQHLKEHIVLWYVNENYKYLSDELREEVDLGDDGVGMVMKQKDPETRGELDATLAVMSPDIMKRAAKVFGKLPPIIQQGVQLAQQYAQAQQPQLPVDPAKMAEVQRRQADDAQKHQEEQQRLALEAQQHQEELAQERELNFANLSAEERREALISARESADAANERYTRLQELQLQERAEDERAAAQMATDLRINSQDNETALRIAAAEMVSDDKVDVKTGTGINPNPSASN